ncbi:hypothetical protein [Guptibacillus algicola]|uniref:hypothetical protein n=1 Tax=Guptibacillus algicola TaxID=225844 RepID=UPI001CD48E3E|nr:hypothetical protein [Alkalihalobacillus algicola]MCA0986340.1 hypothetical protein [Alkalihalobacillus algicola]
MKQRLFLSVLCILFLVYDAVPRFQFDLTMEGAFFGLWLVFALMALGGNFVGLYFGRSEKKGNRASQFEDSAVETRKKLYSR